MAKKGSWDGKTRGGIAGYTIFHLILKYLGISFAYFILYFVAFYFLLFGGKSTTSSFQYFRHTLGYSFFKSIWSVYICYYKFGQTILDKVAILSKKDHPFTSNSIGAKTLWKLAEDGKGAILISAHLGNWEIAGHFLKKLSVPINIVLFDGEHEKIKDMLDNVLKEKRFKIIAIKDDFSHLIEINRALRAKEFICIHGDRYSDHAKGKTMRMNFLGKEAIFPMGPFSLVSRLKVPHAFVFALKVKKYHYEFYAFEGQSAPIKVEEVLQSYVERLEIMVKKYPTQWFNFYKFWEEKEEFKKLG